MNDTASSPDIPAIYTYREAAHSNVGDEINLHLIPKLFNMPLRIAKSISDIDILAIGSILGTFTYEYLDGIQPGLYENVARRMKGKRVTVWGSGFIADMPVSKPFVFDADFLAVRGTLTRRKITEMYGGGGSKTCLLATPACLRRDILARLCLKSTNSA